MTLKKISRDQTQDLRDSVEAELASSSSQAMRRYLSEVREASLRAVKNTTLPNVLVAAAGDEIPGLGTLGSWWAAHVDMTIMPKVRSEYLRVLRRWSDKGIDMDSPAMAASNDYVAKVRDRLVRGTHFSVTVYEESFEKIRASIAAANAEGWTRNQLSQRIASELSWEKNGPYWRQVLSEVDEKIDGILDNIGEPGNPAREHARKHDPLVQHYRDQRNLAIKHLDAEKSVWKTRADLIARTESTGVANFGANEALVMEGVATKIWIATSDSRTRDTHRAADGQEANIREGFSVGADILQYPGDPMGSAGEVANCRCTIVGGEYVEGFL